MFHRSDVGYSSNKAWVKVEDQFSSEGGWKLLTSLEGVKNINRQSSAISEEDEERRHRLRLPSRKIGVKSSWKPCVARLEECRDEARNERMEIRSWYKEWRQNSTF